MCTFILQSIELQSKLIKECISGILNIFLDCLR